MKQLSRYGLILLSGILFFSIPLQAQAMTTEKLDTLIKSDGLDTGVEMALTEGMSVENILITSLTTKNHNAKDILLTLCLAGANNAAIRAAAMSQNISVLIFTSAMESCANQRPEAQAYTPAEQNRRPPNRPDPPTPPEPPASPATF